MNTLYTVLTGMAAALVLSACQPVMNQVVQAASESVASAAANNKMNQLVGSDISNEPIGGDFSLTDQNGKTVSLADYQGKWIALSFGYTRCPDVCPTNLLGLAETMQLLGEDANKVQVLFVSVDPNRDTPSVLKEYVPLFDEHFIGLTAANDDAIAPVLKAWKIAATKVPVKDGHYSVDHSAGLYLLDPTGKARVYLPYGTTPEQIASDFKILLAN